MGFNSTVLVLNDRIHEIERDPEAFGKEMVQAILGHQGDFVDFMGQSTVMSCAHADTVTILAVGGNCSTVLGYVGNGGHHTQPEDQVEILKRLADDRGFRLVRKPKKKV